MRTEYYLETQYMQPVTLPNGKILGPFISFNDLQPSRYALSYDEVVNINAYYVNVTFIALDSKDLGEDVNDHFHHDFGDNMFPYFGDSNPKATNQNDIEEEDIDNIDHNPSVLSIADMNSLKKYIPVSVILYLSSKN